VWFLFQQRKIHYRYSENKHFIQLYKDEVYYFAECIENNHKPFNDGEAGLKVVKMLEAADKSLKDDYKKIRL